MINALLILALVGGLWAAWHGSVAAWALAASAALTSALSLAGVPFILELWLMIDATVIVAIEYGQIGATERAVRWLFVPVFVLYHTQPEGWRDYVTLIVAAQFLLTVPWDRLGERVWKARTA